MFLATAALFGIGGPLQYLIVRFAKGGEMLGGACIQIAFNVSNAIASFLGGTAIHLGFGLESPRPRRNSACRDRNRNPLLLHPAL